MTASAKKLTEAGVAKTRPPATGRLQIADAVMTGLWLRITHTGARSWSVMYRVPGRKSAQRLTLGRWPAVGVAEARKLARDVLLAVERGDDPAADKREQRQQSEQRFEMVAAEFMKRVIKPRQRRWQLTQGLLDNKLISAWNGRDIASIRKADVLKVLDREMDAGHGRTANQTFQLIKRLFQWAAERDYIQADPTSGVSRPAKERSRDRVLSDSELVAILKACGQLGYPFGAFVKLLVMVGQRRSELAMARWQDVDLDKCLWTIPNDLTKSGREHEVPLSADAVAILDALPRIDGSSLIFPATKVRIKDDVERPISGFSKVKRRLDKLAGVDGWTLHDLRRTAASGMARLGVPPHVLAAVLNHDQASVQGVTAVYNRTRYTKEKRDALALWNHHVAAIVAGEPGNVVPMHGPAAVS